MDANQDRKCEISLWRDRVLDGFPARLHGGKKYFAGADRLPASSSLCWYEIGDRCWLATGTDKARSSFTPCFPHFPKRVEASR